MTRKRKCHSKLNSFVAAAEQVCLQPVLEHGQQRGRRNIGQSPRGKCRNFFRYPNFLKRQGGIAGRKLSCQTQIDSSTGFDTTPACDRQTDGTKDTRTQDDSIYRASITSRGKNK